MLILIVGTGIYLSARCGFLQFRRFWLYVEKHHRRSGKARRGEGQGRGFPFQAMTTALAATVGTGNIAGVAGAIASGGPGRFLMWVSAFRHGDQIFRSRARHQIPRAQRQGRLGRRPDVLHHKRPWQNWKWLAVVFSAFGALAAFGIGNCTQVNTIAGSITGAIGTVTGAELTGDALLDRETDHRRGHRGDRRAGDHRRGQAHRVRHRKARALHERPLYHRLAGHCLFEYRQYRQRFCRYFRRRVQSPGRCGRRGGNHDSGIHETRRFPGRLFKRGGPGLRADGPRRRGYGQPGETGPLGHL